MKYFGMVIEYNIKKMKSKFSFVLAICLAGFFYASCQAGNPTVKETIKKMFTERTLPAMTLSDMNGKKVNLSDLHKDGKLTIVSFWQLGVLHVKKNCQTSITFMKNGKRNIMYRL